MSHLTNQLTPTQKALYDQLATSGGINAKDVSDQDLMDALVALSAVQLTSEGKYVAIVEDEDHDNDEGASHTAAVQPKDFASE